MDAQYVDEARALLVTLATAAADVNMRALTLSTKCEELERALRFVDTLHTRRAAARLARLERAKHDDAQTQQVHESLQDAIQRARQIREALAKKSSSADSEEEKDGGGGCDSEDDAPLDTDAHLESILAMAKSIRSHTPRESTDPSASTATAMVATVSKPPTVGRSPRSPDASTEQPVPPVQLEYPRRMRALLERLRDEAASERAEPFRFVFCRKMIKHLSLHRLPHHQHQSLPLTLGRVQVGYAKQTARLQHALELLERFLRECVAPAKVHVALEAPTLASVFPMYTRIKQGKRMLNLLRDEAVALAERAPPPPPPLSLAAVAHRDAMLERITKRTPHHGISQAAAAVVNNATLAAAWRTVVPGDAHTTRLARLQTAWDADHAASSSSSRVDSAVPVPSSREVTAADAASGYTTALREIVLTDTSNLVLTLFKAIFCDDPDAAPTPLHVKNMLLLLRFADSVALANGRHMRSAVAAQSS